CTIGRGNDAVTRRCGRGPPRSTIPVFGDRVWRAIPLLCGAAQHPHILLASDHKCREHGAVTADLRNGDSQPPLAMPVEDERLQVCPSHRPDVLWSCGCDVEEDGCCRA